MWWTAMMGVLAAEPAIDGTWVLAESSATLASKHEAALAAGLEQLPWVARPIAKGKLAKPIDNCREVELSWADDTLRARCDAKPMFVRSRSTTDPITGEDGKPYTVEVGASGDRVTLAFTGEDGGQITTYVRNGEQLFLTKQIVSDWFTEPVRWTVAYTRK